MHSNVVGSSGVTTARKLLSTCFCLGHVPLIPGTCGTLLAVVIYLLLVQARLGENAVVVCAVLFTGLSLWLTPWAQRYFGVSDPSHFVIDEAAGYMVAVLLVPVGSTTPISVALWAFRFFDIVKPYPIRRIDRLSYSFAVTADDLLAGVYANLLLRIGILVGII